VDVLCVQETWLKPSNAKLDIPGYQVFEQRRTQGNRGGIAILVRKGIKTLKYNGNQYAQGICIDVQGKEKIWVGNVYLPPATSLQRRGVDEEEAKSLIQDILDEIPHNEK
jgi:exonuclease III